MVKGNDDEGSWHVFCDYSEYFKNCGNQFKAHFFDKKYTKFSGKKIRIKKSVPNSVTCTRAKYRDFEKIVSFQFHSNCYGFDE